MNLIPKNNCNIKSYWCTWQTQNFLASESLNNLSENERKEKLLDGDGAKLARSMLNSNTIFGKDGLAFQFDDDVRCNLYFMLDDGWDVDYNIHPDNNIDKFASHIVSTERFPFAVGSPQEKLRIMNDKFKSLGWKGIGIWVCAQQTGKNFNKPFEKDDELYWIERIKWSKYANVEYWKVDWGTYQENVEWRRRLTELGKEYYPELIIEHAICIGPLNSIDPWKIQSGRFKDNDSIYQKTIQTIQFADVFRSYDVIDNLSIPTTLDRIAEEIPNANGYINCEDEMYIGAVLGLQLGIMRSYKRKDKMDEAQAAIRWLKISSPFINTNLITSKEILTDNYSFKKNESWFGGVSGINASQSAPSIIARNTTLPLIKNDKKPYVLVSKHDKYYAIGTFPRVDDRNTYYPLVDVECNCENTEYIGIFGKYKRICFITYSYPKKIYIQSLISECAVEITTRLTIKEDRFEIDGKLIEEIWNSNDYSNPAVVLKISY